MQNPPSSPDRLLATGRDADVFEYGAGLVLRRYRERVGAEQERAVMDYLRAAGYPVPRVEWASATELIMERLPGRTMLAELARRPWSLNRQARLLSELHERLHAIPAPDWLPAPFGPGEALLHLDLHPDNVILTPSGPVVIDWSNTARGPVAADAARTWMLLASSDLPGGPAQRLILGTGRQLFLAAFLRQVDRAAAAALLPAIIRHRLQARDPSPAERAFLQRWLARLTPGLWA